MSKRQLSKVKQTHTKVLVVSRELKCGAKPGS